ncbi:hypothetical protein AST00_12600 [Staphylococcus equorum]|nr:hypothetical protein AST00_12600 [Staphylococcus equorum]OEK70600.1 hypothetical protein AST02_03875 [Staphylococcus equorum]
MKTKIAFKKPKLVIHQYFLTVEFLKMMVLWVDPCRKYASQRLQQTESLSAVNMHKKIPTKSLDLVGSKKR